MKKEILENRKTWNVVADQFFDACALPVWGPFDIGKRLNLIPHIKGKTFLEIGCGSGRSINYLLKQGAKKVYGLDFSDTQIEEAKRFNQSFLKDEKAVLIKSCMEDKIDIPSVDIVFSVYALGWTQNPKKTLSNIHSYLKSGGLFLWSWDHTFFSDVEYKNGQHIVVHSYHDETSSKLENWKGSGGNVSIIYRKTATWFKLLTDSGFDVVGYYEPAPESTSEEYDSQTRYYSIKKAQKVPSSFIFVCKKR